MESRTRRSFSGWGAALVTVLTASTALGEPTGQPTVPAPQAPAPVNDQLNDADREVARTRMAEGRALRETKNFQEALEAFRKADSLMGFPTTGFEVGRAEVDLGLLVEGKATLQRVIAIPEDPNELLAFTKAREHARELLAEVRTRMATIHVSVVGGGDAHVDVLIDAHPASASAPEEVNPGHHVLTAVAPWGEARQEVVLQEKAALDVTLALPLAPAVSTTRSLLPVVVPEPVSPTRPPNTARVASYVGFSVGGAGLIGGAILGGLSLANTRSAEQGCHGNQCPPPTHGDLSTAGTEATVCDVLLVVGGLGVAAGIVGITIKPRAEAAPKAAIAPWFGYKAAGFKGVF